MMGYWGIRGGWASAPNLLAGHQEASEKRQAKPGAPVRSWLETVIRNLLSMPLRARGIGTK
jgi:hypothetical protein